MSDITDEQRVAWQWLQKNAPGNAESIAPLLPSELTNPQPVLPTEPGTTIYGGTDQPRILFRLIGLSAHRPWIDAWSQHYSDDEARDLMGEWDQTPPSVVERPQIAAAELREAVRNGGYQKEWPDVLAAYLKSRDRD